MHCSPSDGRTEKPSHRGAPLLTRKKKMFNICIQCITFKGHTYMGIKRFKCHNVIIQKWFQDSDLYHNLQDYNLIIIYLLTLKLKFVKRFQDYLGKKFIILSN